jgi:hypothetical protein
VEGTKCCCEDRLTPGRSNEKSRAPAGAFLRVCVRGYMMTASQGRDTSRSEGTVPAPYAAPSPKGVLTSMDTNDLASGMHRHEPSMPQHPPAAASLSSGLRVAEGQKEPVSVLGGGLRILLPGRCRRQGSNLPRQGTEGERDFLHLGRGHVD